MSNVLIADKLTSIFPEQICNSVFELSPVPMIIVDNSFKIVMANKSVEDLFGFPKQDLVNEDIINFVPYRFKELVYESMVVFIHTDCECKLGDIETIEIPENVKKLAAERETARADKNFAESDRLRAEIESLGFIVKDTPDGSEIEPK